MFRSFAAPALFVSLALVACSSDEEYRYHHGGSGGYVVDCSAYSTCGTCTPVMGCGWCEYENGDGRCAPGPGYCGDDQPFRWNWDPKTCPASITPSDAGVDDAPEAASEASTAEAATEDAAPEAASETDPDDASSEAAAEAASEAAAPTCVVPAAATTSSCAPTTGGTLCKDGQYTLGCHGGAPDSSLACTKVLSTADGTYHCCSCASSP